ncbi:MAG: hypothetical protein HY343_08195 [Lentisphaerae bacterium]|nr:hypothetical protein [Lentisphaerota bacterium]
MYVFLARQFAAGDVSTNYLFQFVFRSFYRIDNAGLTSDFKSEYFRLMEDARVRGDVDLKAVVLALRPFPNRKGQQTLQFSFTTKLANTVRSDYPIYDSEVARVFGFGTPYNYRPFEDRLDRYLACYERIRDAYSEILATDALLEPRERFRRQYGVTPDMMPEMKVLDFIMWRAGKLGLKVRGADH